MPVQLDLRLVPAAVSSARELPQLVLNLQVLCCPSHLSNGIASISLLL